MTIKEAFALLANNISAGMKNPFFIARKLHDSFVEIEENISGGGEPTVVDAYDVTYQQSNVGAALDYINQGVQYSTTRERIVGKWIDGKVIYQKTINFGAIPSNSTKEVDHGITGLGTVVGIEGIMYNSDGVTFETLPSGESVSRVQVNGSKIKVITNSSWTSWTDSYITIKYTKS